MFEVDEFKPYCLRELFVDPQPVDAELRHELADRAKSLVVVGTFGVWQTGNQAKK